MALGQTLSVSPSLLPLTQLFCSSPVYIVARIVTTKTMLLPLTNGVLNGTKLIQPTQCVLKTRVQQSKMLNTC